jgi:hypothetical protein
MSKIVFLALIVGGLVLITMGVSAMDSFSSRVSRFFSGSPTNKAICLLVGGCVATAIGLCGVFIGSKR